MSYHFLFYWSYAHIHTLLRDQSLVRRIDYLLLVLSVCVPNTSSSCLYSSCCPAAVPLVLQCVHPCARTLVFAPRAFPLSLLPAHTHLHTHSHTYTIHTRHTNIIATIIPVTTGCFGKFNFGFQSLQIFIELTILFFKLTIQTTFPFIILLGASR